MLADLENVLEICKIDREIHFLNKRRKDLPTEIEKINLWMQGENASVVALEERAQALEKESRSLEVDVADAKEKKKKSEDRLMSITTNAEYDAVHNEIEAHKRNTAKAEDRALQIMAELEQLAPKRKAAQEKLSGEEVKVKEAELAKFTSELEAMDQEIAARMAVRAEAVKKVDVKIMRIYDKLHKARPNGKCVGVVTDAKRVCGSCAIRLTPQKFINVKKSETLQTCESCGAILTWQKE